MRARHPVLAVLTMVFCLVIATSPGAHAATTWQVGTKLSNAPSFALMDGQVWVVEAAMYGGDARGCDSGARVATGAVREDGDYIYVRDDCADGRSAVVRFRPYGNSTEPTRICRNPHGKGTWARCNFDWPENKDYCVAGGVHNADTGFLRFDVNVMAELCGDIG